MSSRGCVIRAVLGAIGWAWLGLGLAQAGAILPTDPATLKSIAGASVTVSLYQLDLGSVLPSAATLTLNSSSRCTTTNTGLYKDVTGCWLPEWDPVNGGKSVYIVVNGSQNLPTLVQPTTTLTPGSGTNPFLASLTTSAYPGKCTNFGSAADADYAGPDFTLDLTPVPLPTSTGTVTGYKLTPNDCGGMAVIQVGSLKFILPQDGTATVAANGLPDVWENLYGGSLNPATDIDTGPAAASPVGDGNSTFDEYRGYIVSGKQIRTDPTQKDLFLYLVRHADSVGSVSCGASCFDVGGVGGGTITYPTLNESLFAVVYTLVPPAQLHLLGPDPTNPSTTTEWVDKFVSLVPAQTLTISDSVMDRTVNPNRLYGLAQKGVRIMEGLNTNSPSVLGWAFAVASPNQAGNVAVFAQRVINYIDSLIAGAATLNYSTASLNNGVLTWTTPITVDRNFILSKALEFYMAMEVHHSLDLTPGVQGTTKTSYGHHFAPGTGDCLDQAITTTSKGSTLTFNIPSVCGTADQTQYLLE